MRGKKILITGATGMVGSYALRYLLDDIQVEHVVSIGRRSIGIKNVKLKEIVHRNFLNFSPIENELKDIDACIYCLGVYQSLVSAEDYHKITCGYQQTLTDVLEKASPNCVFILFGAAGADTSGKSRILFAKVKGEAENLLMKTAFPGKYIFRPGYIHPTGKRKPPGFWYKVSLPLTTLLFRIFPSIGIEDKHLAKAMVRTALRVTTGSATYDNSDIRKMINLD